MTEHSINRSGTAQNSHDEHTEDDTDYAADEDTRSKAEIKRELRKSEVGRAILRRNRELKDRRSGLNGR